ncbi:MAG TPA: hypothetical protein VKP67_21740 [Xanthobacteraceae bacterium]|nr:hypothetical protein [Xanthobacteraceae bacterium]
MDWLAVRWRTDSKTVGESNVRPVTKWVLLTIVNVAIVTVLFVALA